MFYKSFYDSPLGLLSLVAMEDTLYGIWLEGQKYYEAGLEGEELIPEETPILMQTKRWLDAYFAGHLSDSSHLPLAKRGTPFQERVWQALSRLSYGQTITYGQLGEQIGCRSSQAVGSAVGRNPWLILIPCHRVLPKAGGLGGFVAGSPAKRYLLALEGVSIDKRDRLNYPRKRRTTMYTFYQYPKCTTCRKAKAELEDLGLDFESIDIKQNPPSASFLKELLKGSDLELKKFFNTSGQSYRALGLKDKLPQMGVDQAVELLASDGMLIKRPILIKDGKVLQIGYRTPYKELNL